MRKGEGARNRPFADSRRLEQERIGVVQRIVRQQLPCVILRDGDAVSRSRSSRLSLRSRRPGAQ